MPSVGQRRRPRSPSAPGGCFSVAVRSARDPLRRAEAVTWNQSTRARSHLRKIRLVRWRSHFLELALGASAPGAGGFQRGLPDLASCFRGVGSATVLDGLPSLVKSVDQDPNGIGVKNAATVLLEILSDCRPPQLWGARSTRPRNWIENSLVSTKHGPRAGREYRGSSPDRSGAVLQVASSPCTFLGVGSKVSQLGTS